jgi:hypothetical protein
MRVAVEDRLKDSTGVVVVLVFMQSMKCSKLHKVNSIQGGSTPSYPQA